MFLSLLRLRPRVCEVGRGSNLIRDCFFVFSVFFAIFFLSCSNNLPVNSDEKPLAKVGDAYLFPSQLKEIISKSAEQKDSVEIVRNYVNNWIHETLLLQQAEKNLTDDLKKFDKMVENYRKSLITYEYESELVKQKLDTIVSDDEIEKYYEENKSNFELKDNIIKVIYVKVRKNAPKVEKIKEWYKSNEAKDRDALSSYCYQYADNFYLDENIWLLFDDVLKEIPMKLYDKEAFLQNNRTIETQDSAHYYFVNIKGFMTKNSTSPLSFEKENIRSIILNKRKVELIKKMREDIYNEGVKNKSFEIY
ncbi:MAG: peptidyl-prolyl cis-trans isomerase [Bacteroidetes bacterium]|nr:peptidyl-prolyl cis-trans isomerase [Bacteroidota bacterium]